MIKWKFCLNLSILGGINIMTKPILTINDLIQEAKIFCEFMSSENHSELLGVTDGKAVGTYVEHKF